MKTLFTLLAIMSHDNGAPIDVFVVDHGLSYEDCEYAQEGLEPIMAEGILLICELEN